MKPTFVKAHGRPRSRHAFTLVELLVVLAILAVLTALAATGTIEVIATQRQANTEAMIRVVDKTLQQHWQHVVTEAKKESPSTAVTSLAGGDTERARVIWIKLRLLEAFPQSYAEIQANPLYAGGWIPADRRKYIASYKPGLNGLSSAPKPATESAACLLLALTVARSGATSLQADVLASSVADTDGDGVNELVDGWRQPLTFRRFFHSQELQNLNPNTKGRAATFCDPQDPNGSLMDKTWYGSAQRGTYEGLCGYQISSLVAGRANLVLPVVFSTGRDYGDPAALPPSPNNPDDDIFSFRLKLDARGN